MDTKTRLSTYDCTLARTLYAHSPEITFIYVSGQGTDATEKGRMMWARVKGKTENHAPKDILILAKQTPA